MLLDTQATFVRATTLGFRSDSTGALSADWALNTSVTTPGDIHVFADGGINVCRAPVGMATAPAVAYTPREFTDSRYYRLRATLRVHAVTARTSIGASSTNAAPLVGHTLIHLINGNVFGSGTSALMLRCATSNLSLFHHFTVTLEKWYRVVLERVNNQFLLYASTTGVTTPNDVPEDNTLALVLDSGVISISSPPLWAEAAISNAAVSGTSYSGISDFILEEFQPLPAQAVSAVSTGFSVPSPTPYTRYKSARAAVALYNNLVLGP